MSRKFIEHERYGFGKKSTLSRLGAWGMFRGFALEDERREVKVYGETCMGLGIYRILLRTEGGKHEDYLRRFGTRHKGMLWFQDVENFSFLYYHIGNFESQTLGCPLVGTTPRILTTGEFEVGSSTRAYHKFYDLVAAEILSGTKVFSRIREAGPS